MFAGLLCAASAAQGAVTVNKTFSPSSMTVGGTSTITITLGNTGTSAATGTAFTDTLPGGLVVASPSNVATTCGGSASAASGGSTVSLSGGTIPANGGTCTVTALVTSSTLGSYTNTIPAGGVTSSQGSNGSPASATLAVIARQPVTGSWAVTFPTGFSGNLKGNGPAYTYKVTLNNPNTLALTNLGLTFSLQAPMLAFATPSNLTTTCGGTITANTGAGTGTLSGGTLPANGSCTIKFDVIAAQPNVFFYGSAALTLPAGAITDDQGISNSAVINFGIGLQTGSRVDKSFLPTSIASGGASTSTLTLTINNFNFSALSPLNLADTLPSGMTVASTPNASTTCASGTVTAAAGSSSVQLTGGSLASVAQTATTSVACTVKVDVVGTNAGTTNINLTNAIPAGNFGGVSYPAASAILTVTPGGRVQKSFSPTSILSGGTSTLTVTLDNFTATANSPINLTDTLPAGLTVAGAPNVTNTCGGTVTAAPGSGSVTLTGGALAAAPGAGSSCTFTANVTGTTAGAYTNTILGGNWNGTSYSSASATLTISTPFTVSKVFGYVQYGPRRIDYTGYAQASTITLTNNTAAPITVSSLLDDLTTMGTGFTVASTQTPSTTCVGGTVNAPVGGTTITMTGGTIPASGSCTVTADIRAQLGATTLINHINTIPAGNVVTSAGSNLIPASWSALFYSPLVIDKAFAPAAVNAGGTSTLTITLSYGFLGGTGVDAMTNISDSDVLPTGLVIASPSSVSHTCNAGTAITAPAGGSTVAFSGVNLNPGTNCTISVKVLVPAGTPTGTLSNVIPGSTATTDQGVTNETRLIGGGNFAGGAAAANLGVTNTNVTINKTFTPATVAVGSVSQLAINFVNTNPGNIGLTGMSLTDALPLGMVVANPANASYATAGCTGTVTATPGASTVALSNASIAAGVTCTLKVNVVGSAAGNLTNTIPAGALSSAQSVTNTAPTATTLTVTGTADLAITKTDSVASVAAGTATTYTVRVSNAGPNNVIGATVADTPPSGMTFTSWTCAASSGAACGAASGTGPINDTININTGSTVTYTVTAQIDIGYSGASITNTATVTPPGIVADPNQGNNTASDTDTVVPGVVLALTKSDGSTSYTPGGTATYTVTVANTGAASATQVNVNDALPSGVTLAGNVTCTPAGTATCGTVTGGAGQTSFGATNATIPNGAASKLTFTVPVAFGASLTANPLINTVTATDVPSGATGSASDSDTLSASANLSIAKSGPASVVPGAPISYTLTIANAGPSDANGATFNDPVPASISGVNASCGSASGGAVCPGAVTVAGNNVSGTIPTLPPGGAVVITINGTTLASTSAPITNTASVSAPSGVTDPVTGNNSSPWTTSLKPTVRIDKTVNATSVIPGDMVTYTITVTNTGMVAAPNTLVTDPVPNGITAQTWTCAASGGAVCPTASGSGAISQTIATFPPGSSVVYTATATVSTTPPTNINNTATATPPNGACSPANTPPPCSATASLPPVPQIGVSKIANTTTVTPGGTIVYTIVVSNTGVVAANGTPVDDPIPVGVTSQGWTCAASGGAACTTSSGTGAISDVISTFPAGSFVTYTVTAIVDAAPPAIVSNTVTVTPSDPTTVCTPGNTRGPCTATANVTSNPQISISKTADTSTLTPGGTVTYTVTVTNTGAAAADGTTVDDPVPTGIAVQTWTCAANAGAVCAPSGTGAISDTLTAFPPGSFVTYTIVATIAGNPPATITNIATAYPPPGGLCTPGNTPAPCDAEVSGGAVPQISVTKTSDATGALTPGGTVTYTVTVTNAGSADAPNTLVSDTMPTGIAAATWTCAASGGAVCPNASGGGNINETLATFPSGSTVVYTIIATVSALPPASINNTANVMPPSGVCLPGNTAPPCTATASNASAPQISVVKTADDPSYTGGGTLSWTVTVTNTGSAAADGTTVSDPLPPGIVSSAWTCLPSGGAVCENANGNDAIVESIPTFPPGSAVTYVITGTVAAPAPIRITNTAAATPPAGGTCAPANAAPPCTGTVTTTSAPSVTTTKSVADANGNGIADPGETLTYTIVLTNSGGTNATGFGVTDPLDPNTTFVSASNGGTLAGNTVTWSGLTVPAGSNVALTLVTTVASPLPAGVTQIANVAYETGTTAPPCPPVGPACVVLPTPGSATLTKSVLDANANGIAEAGESLTYTILLTNTGGSDVVGYGVTDPLDPNVVFVSADNGGTETAGVVTWTNLTVPAGGSLVLSVVATVADPLASGVTEIANVAYETGTTAPACPPAGPQCVVLPTPGSVTIAKSVADANGNGVADAGEQLTYTILLSNAGGSAITGFDLTDPLDANVAFVSASNGGAFAGGVVNWTGLTVPAGGNLALTVVVTVANPIPSGVIALTNVAYASGGTPPDCTAGPRPANCNVIATAPAIAIGKTAGTPTPTGTPNEFTLTYTAMVSNTGGSIGHYNLADTLTFNGATVTAISAPAYGSSTGDTQTGAVGAFVPPSGGTIVTNEDLGVGGVETWTYTVTYTVDDAAIASDCASALGGLRNSAVLGGAAAGAPPAETCSGAASVNILKSASVPVPTGNPNEFTLTYTVNVSNTGTLIGTYDLSDVLTFNGATLSVISAPAYSTSTGDTQDGTLGAFGLPDGGVIVSGESISAGGAETWSYTVTYTVTDSVIAEDCADPNGGLRNSAALGGSFSGQSATCTGAPAVTVGKSASGPVPTGNPNEYTLTYLVTVQNNGSLSGTYDLDDTFAFPGVNNVTPSAITHNGPDPLSSTLGILTASGGNIVIGETIAGGASESYAYSVTFTVDDANAVGTCATGGGLANNAALGGSSTGQVVTCSDVPSVAIAKSATAPVPTGTPNQYTLTYTVTATNAGAAVGTYDLADAFTFAGATIDAVSAISHGGSDPLATTLGTLTSAGGTIVMGETIAGGSSETYTYTVTFTLTDPATANDCTNPANGLRNEATLGGSAAGSAATCNGAPSISIAKTVTDANGNGVAEQGETLTYTITLTNAGAVDQTNYSVTDPLDPNVTFVSADNGGVFAGGVVTWSGLTVPANGSLNLTVVVTVANPIPDGVTQLSNVAYATGATAPDCTATPMPANCAVIPTAAPGTITITKSVEDGTHGGSAEPGEPLTYTITLTNTGGGDVTNFSVTDPLDANTVFSSASNGGAFNAGVVTWTGLTIPAGGSLSLIVVVTVVDPVPPGVTEIDNLAYETGTTPPDCTTTPMPPNCTSIPVTPGAVSIVKTVADANGDNVAEPGETLTYTVTVSNTGGGDVTNFSVTDPLDPNVAYVSSDNGGTFAGGTVRWSGLTVPAGGSLSLIVVVTVVDPISPGVTEIDNLAYETGTAPPNCAATPVPPNCTSIPVPSAGAVSVIKTVHDANGDNLAEPGETLTYTITLANTGGADATIGITDPLDPNVAFVSADNGGALAGSTVTWSGLTVPANGTLTLTVTVAVTDPIPSGVSAIRNVAYPTGTTAADCTSTPTPPSCAVIATPPPSGTSELLIQKSANTTSTTPGGTVIYTVAVSNVGTAAATNVVISDPVPPGITSYAWTCSATGGAACANSNGNGAIAETIATVPVDGALTYTVTAVLSTSPPPSITNVANVMSGGASICAPSGSPPPCTSGVVVNVTPGGGGNQPIAAPIDSRWMLLLMTVILMGAGARARRRI